MRSPLERFVERRWVYATVAVGVVVVLKWMGCPYGNIGGSAAIAACSA